MKKNTFEISSRAEEEIKATIRNCGKELKNIMSYCGLTHLQISLDIRPDIHERSLGVRINGSCTETLERLYDEDLK